MHTSKTRRFKKRDYRTLDQRRADEHYENYVKSAFGAACQRATKLGWSWVFEGETIVVTMPGHVIECSDRLDFAALVSEER